MKTPKISITAEAKAGVAIIRIVDIISEETTSGAAYLRSLIDGFIAQGITQADVYINSKGGNVFEAVEIVNELNRFVTVKVKVGSIAASAATYLTSSFYTTGKASSKFMIHKPAMGTQGNLDSIKADIKLLESVTQDYLNTYSKKTGKSTGEISELWSKGDYWMTAAEALKMGFIDAIDDNIAEPVTASKSLHIDARSVSSSRATWTLDDYLDKDPEALAAMKQSDPTYAKRLEDEYFGNSGKQITKNVAPAATVSAVTTGSRSTWTLDDYLDKDPEALAAMKQSDPAQAKRLEDEYFNSK